MCWRLAGSLNAVVAADAAAGDRRVVHTRDRRPTGRDMTIRTFAIGRHMIHRLRRGTHDAALGVAAAATRIGRSERAGHMASFAGNVAVAAVERESGTKVVETLLRLCGGCGP